MTWAATILTLYEMFPEPLGARLVGRSVMCHASLEAAGGTLYIREVYTEIEW